VHHVIVYLVSGAEAAKFRAYDQAEAGPGYTCYGGPQASSASGGLEGLDPRQVLAALQKLGLTPDDVRSKRITEAQFVALASELGREPGSFRSIGSWVPGAPASPFPAGTGIRVEPGSVIVAQVHYNTNSVDPSPDQSVIEVATTGAVQREAILMQALDLGWVSNGIVGQPMTIPAGAAKVEHSTSLGFDSTFITLARRNLRLPETAPLVIHTANHHMHERGTRQRSELRRADGSTACLLDIPAWDFQWQGSYTLTTPITMKAGDQLWMGCTWDNSAANQPIINGVPATPATLSWGEGTSDEMCLGGFYVTGE
jgi:hypothetical protein